MDSQKGFAVAPMNYHMGSVMVDVWYDSPSRENRMRFGVVEYTLDQMQMG